MNSRSLHPTLKILCFVQLVGDAVQYQKQSLALCRGYIKLQNVKPHRASHLGPLEVEHAKASPWSNVNVEPKM